MRVASGSKTLASSRGQDDITLIGNSSTRLVDCNSLTAIRRLQLRQGLVRPVPVRHAFFLQPRGFFLHPRGCSGLRAAEPCGCERAAAGQAPAPPRRASSVLRRALVLGRRRGDRDDVLWGPFAVGRLHDERPVYGGLFGCWRVGASLPRLLAGGDRRGCRLRNGRLGNLRAVRRVWHSHGDVLRERRLRVVPRLGGRRHERGGRKRRPVRRGPRRRLDVPRLRRLVLVRRLPRAGPQRVRLELRRFAFGADLGRFKGGLRQRRRRRRRRRQNYRPHCGRGRHCDRRDWPLDLLSREKTKRPPRRRPRRSKSRYWVQ